MALEGLGEARPKRVSRMDFQAKGRAIAKALRGEQEKKDDCGWRD